MMIKVRNFNDDDSERLIEILKLNGQYAFPETEGPDAMKRVSECDAAVMLVAEIGPSICGFIKAVFDGSRALIHLLSVHPDYQHSGAGKILVEAVAKTLQRKGAPTISVTATEESAGFWEACGFRRLPVFLMLKEMK